MVAAAGVTVAVEAIVAVCRGIEMKELQNLVAEALIVGLCKILTISDTTWQVERPRAASSLGVVATGVPYTCKMKHEESNSADNFVNAIRIARLRRSIKGCNKGLSQ